MRLNALLPLLLAAAASSVAAAPPAAKRAAAPAEEMLIKAMRDELARTLETLQIAKLDKPYFVSYLVPDETALAVSAHLGAVVSRSEYRHRSVKVELRVGDRKLDNTGYLGAPSSGSGMRFYYGSSSLPLEDDYGEIRRQLWLATDAAYKKAVEDLAKKRAALETSSRGDDAPDFSEEPAAQVEDVAAVPPPPVAAVEAVARTLSSAFNETPEVTASLVQVHARALLTRYLNSEGSSFKRSSPRLVLTVNAATQAADGTPLEDAFLAAGQALADLPPTERLRGEALELGNRLGRLRQAPVLQSYNGPVLFEGQAAAEVFAQAFAPKLLATRLPVVDQALSGYVRMQGALENPFLDRIGGRVLAAGVSVVDDATAARKEGALLLGRYAVDDEGVPARQTTLVANGFLKALLSTRTPVRTIAHSTGNRRGDGPLPSNLLVTSANAVGAAEMRMALLALVKERGAPFGLIVKRLGSPAMAMRPFAGSSPMMGLSQDANRIENACLVVKLLPDGTEEPVRVAEIVGVGPEQFKDIKAVSNEPTVHTTYVTPPGLRNFSYGFALPGSRELVSLVVPALLFEELSVRKPSGEIPRPPVGSHPSFAQNQ